MDELDVGRVSLSTGEVLPVDENGVVDPKPVEIDQDGLPKPKRNKKSAPKAAVAREPVTQVLGVSDEEAKAALRDLKKTMAEKFNSPAFSGGATCETPSTEAPITFYTFDELMASASEPINWAVQDLYTERGRIVVAAEQKAGKTFLVTSLAVSVASGLPFLGRLPITKPGPVLILAGEDDRREVARRIHRMMRALGITGKLPIHFGDAHGARMNRPLEIEIVRKNVEETGAVLVIADPLARLMEGDENSKECIASVLNPAGRLADKSPHGTSFCFVHHLGKQSQDNAGRSSANRVRGSSDIASWFTCGIFLTGSMDEGKIQLEVIQRTSGNIPYKFPVNIIEDRDLSIYGKGTMKLVAELDTDKSKSLFDTSDDEINHVADAINDLMTEVGNSGATKTEIMTRLRYSERFVKVGLERLLIERRSVVKRKNSAAGLEKIRFFHETFAPPDEIDDLDRGYPKEWDDADIKEVDGPVQRGLPF